MSSGQDESDRSAPEQSLLREVRYRHTHNVPSLLRHLGCSLLVSTYQAGKLVNVGSSGETLQFAFHNFDQVMGLALSPTRLAVATKGQIWFLQGQHDLAPTLAPVGSFDRCYLARSAAVTGSIHCHEISWDSNGDLWIVNTLFSCLATLDANYSFVPRWHPPFISRLAGEDRCHLNGLAMSAGRPAFVTMLAESDEPAGWRPHKESSGLVMDLSSQQVVSRGLAMPHSPRLHDEQLWVLNSGRGTLENIDLRTGDRDVVESLPGYARGLDFCDRFAFVGLSRIRETAVFGGLPIAQAEAKLRCGVAVVDLRSGRTVGTIEFEKGVEEIFDVRVLPNVVNAKICGPRPDQDGHEDVWVVPQGREAGGL